MRGIERSAAFRQWGRRFLREFSQSEAFSNSVKFRFAERLDTLEKHPLQDRPTFFVFSYLFASDFLPETFLDSLAASVWTLIEDLSSPVFIVYLNSLDRQANLKYLRFCQKVGFDQSAEALWEQLRGDESKQIGGQVRPVRYQTFGNSEKTVKYIGEVFSIERE